jgi:hypothetical protein
MKIHSALYRLLQADRWTDRRTDMSKLIAEYLQLFIAITPETAR